MLCVFFSLLCALPTSAFATAPGSPASHAHTSQNIYTEQSDEQGKPIRVSTSAQQEGVLYPGQPLVIDIAITNTSPSPITASSISLWYINQILVTREALFEWINNGDNVSPRSKHTLAQLPPPEIQPNETVNTSATIALESLEFTNTSAINSYPIGVNVVVENETIQSRSIVTWVPNPSEEYVGVSVLLPLIAPPTSAGFLSREELETYTQPNGIFTQYLDGIAQYPAVFVGIDPMIIASIRALGDKAPKNVTDWLKRLSEILNPTFSLGYGDPDLVGKIDSGSPDHLSEHPNLTFLSQTQDPPIPAEEFLQWDYTMNSLAWPAPNTLRNEHIPSLSQAGYQHILVSDKNTSKDFPPQASNAHLLINETSFLMTDSVLSELMSTAITTTNDAVWRATAAQISAHLYKHEKQNITQQNIIALERVLPSNATQISRTLSLINTVSKTSFSSLAKVITEPPETNLSLVDATPDTTRIDALKEIRYSNNKLNHFSTMLDDPNLFSSREEAKLLTLFSTSWMNVRSEWEKEIVSFQEKATATLNSIHIAPMQNITLAATQGSIPFTITNSLTEQAVRVTVHVATSNRRLEIGAPESKHIAPQSQSTLLVPVKTQLGNGQVTLRLQLVTPTGQRVGHPTSVNVNVHADWEGIGALLVGIVLIALFASGVIRTLRKTKKAQKKHEH